MKQEVAVDLAVAVAADHGHIGGGYIAYVTHQLSNDTTTTTTTPPRPDALRGVLVLQVHRAIVEQGVRVEDGFRDRGRPVDEVLAARHELDVDEQ